MSIKGLFEKKKEGSGFSKNVVTSSAARFNVDVESDDLVKAYQNNTARQKTIMQTRLKEFIINIHMMDLLPVS